MSCHSVELRVGRRCQCHRPMWPVERWQQWETVVDEFRTIGNQDLSTIGDHWPNSGQLVVVPVRDFEDGESPDAPSLMCFLDGSSEVIALEGSRAEPHHDEPGNNVLVAKNERLEHLTEARTQTPWKIGRGLTR